MATNGYETIYERCDIMDAEDIENLDETTIYIQKTVRKVLSLFMTVFYNQGQYFTEGDDDTGLYNCPQCDYQFHPAEVGIDIKTFDEWWAQQKKDNTYVGNINENINEQITDLMAGLITTIKTKTKQPLDDRSEIKALKTTIRSLKDIDTILANYAAQIKAGGDIPNTDEYRALKQIDDIMIKVQNALATPQRPVSSV